MWSVHSLPALSVTILLHYLPIAWSLSSPADAVVREFIASPMPTTADLAPEVGLLGSRQEAMGTPAPRAKSAAPANSRNGNIFGEC